MRIPKNLPLPGTPEARVLLARDVIAQIKARRYIARCGTYMNPLKEESLLLREAVQFARSSAPCEVCARGALFLSELKLYNEFEGGVNLNPDGEVEERFFDEQHLAIEQAFEQSAYDQEEYSIPGCECSSCRMARGELATWGNTYPDPEKRLIAIMRNIIRNKGKFKENEIVPPRRQRKATETETTS
jgi:hypothetical protein